MSLTSTVATLGVFAVVLSAVPGVSAQTPVSEPRAWEFRVSSGGMLPTGSQRLAVDDAQLTAVQVTRLVRPSVAITGTFGWARSRGLSVGGSPKLDVFGGDMGVEARPASWQAGQRVRFRPFVGAGLGTRSYNYRATGVETTHSATGYVGAGAEIGVRRIALRLEVRDYVTGPGAFAGRRGGDTRNDIVVMTGLRFTR